jgi:hypothetical protein
MTKKEQMKATREQYKKDRIWHDYEMGICYNPDYCVYEGYFEYIIYRDIDTKEFHLDLPNGMMFVASSIKECRALAEVYA